VKSGRYLGNKVRQTCLVTTALSFKVKVDAVKILRLNGANECYGKRGWGGR
jgi:hypothetical protein